MLRLQENTPSVYTDESRDFQLFCRLYDSVINSTKFDIDTIINILDPMFVNDKLLDLMCTKVGFFPRHELNSNTLRYILKVFPYLIKRKGSKKGIEGAVKCMFNIEHTLDATLYVTIDKQNCEVILRSDKDIKDKIALNELLRYLIPVGYVYSWNIVKVEKEKSDSTLGLNMTYNLYQSPTTDNSIILNADQPIPTGDLKYQGTIQQVQISQDYRVIVEVENGVCLSKDDYILKNGSAHITVKPNDGYSLNSAVITVTNCRIRSSYYDRDNNMIKLFARDPYGDVHVSVKFSLDGGNNN